MNSLSSDKNGKVLEVNLFGEFSMICGEKKIDEKTSRSRKVWMLLEYLFVFRNKEISQNELIELLWPDGEIDDPANTLKTLLHRVRAVVSELGYVSGKDMIIYRHGSYSWNNTLPVRVDVDEFERLSALAATEKDLTAKISYLLRACELYKGEFLPKSSLEHWVIPLATYYHSAYLKLAHDALSLLSEVGQFDEIIALCQRALIVDPYDEELHYSLIQALVATGAQKQAMAHYSYVTDMFFRNFGVSPSPTLTGLYKEIVTVTNTAELDLNIIKDRLREHEVTARAFFCEYGVFKDIYQLQARTLSRNGRSVHIALVSVSFPAQSKDLLGATNTAMDQLHVVIMDSLRKGDVFCRYSVSQYLLMLPAASFEGADTVLRRVLSSFRRKHSKSKVMLQYKALPIDPSG